MSKDQPLVTICVPTYNDGPFLLESLESILLQTYSFIEILVGDNCSTDNTAEIVLALKDPRIHYHRNDVNLGVFGNVNSLIRRAQGKYVAVYNSDDVYESRIVEKEVDFLEAHPDVGAIFALDWWIDTDGRVIGKCRLLPGVRPRACLSLEDVMPVLMRHKNQVFRAPTFMARREVFDRVGLFSRECDVAGDFEMWLRILTEYRVGILDEHLMRYRQSASQVSSQYDYLRTEEEQFFSIMDHYLATSGLAESMDKTSLIEYAFHRCDDETFRAANLVIQGEADRAIEVLQRPYPWRTLATNLKRRKFRVLVLRSLMRGGLAIGASRPLAEFLYWFEYRGRAQ